MKQKPDKARNTIVIYCAKGVASPIYDAFEAIHSLWYKKTGEALTNSGVVLRALLFYREFLENENKYETKGNMELKDNSTKFSRIR